MNSNFYCIKKTCKYSFCIFLLLQVFMVTTYAQKRGKLTGKILDVSSNEPLLGVSVTAKGSNIGVASVNDGNYTLSIMPGTYTIRFSITGYKTKEISGVEIKADDVTFLDMMMEVGKKELEAVVVTRSIKKESQASVYSIQKRSAAASDGISLEAIVRTPDNNSAQILKRVTGVNIVDNKFIVVRGLGAQYNQTVLNGVPMTSTESNQNAFAFDLIPAAAIDNIVINKTATPDMPGSFAGGIVQVNTKDFPTKDFLSVSFQLGLSDQTYGKPFYGDKRAKYQVLGFDGGIRDLPKGFPGNTDRVPFVFLNYQEQLRYLSQLPNNLVPINHGASGFNNQVQLGYGKNINFKNKTQLGIVVSLNQRKTQLIEEDIQLRNIDQNFINETSFMFSEKKDILKQDTVNAIAGKYAENMRYKYAVDLGGVLNLAYRFGNNKITIKNLYTQVYNNQFINRPYVYDQKSLINNGGLPVSFGLAYINSTKRFINSIVGGEHRTGINNETRIDWNLSTTFNNTKLPDTRNFIFITDSTKKYVGTESNNSSIKDKLAMASRLWTKLSDFIYSGGFNINTPFAIAKQKQLFKTGFFFQNRVRQARASVIPLQISGSTLDSVLSVNSIYAKKTAVEVVAASFAEQGGDYNAGSSLFALYESIESKIGKNLRVIWGLRVEKYQQNANVFKTIYYIGFQYPEYKPYTFAARTELNFLPSINIIYSPTPAINIRAAFANTAIRPDLKDILSIYSYDFTNFRLTTGNPELRSTVINNFDLKAEWFPSAGEIVSIAGFYKKMKNPIEYVTPDIQSSFGVADVAGVPVNTGNAIVQGVEIELRKKLDFISNAPWLKNISLFGNGTLLSAKVLQQFVQSNAIKEVLAHNLTGQARYIINGGITISAFKNTFEATGSFNKTGDYITELGGFERLNSTIVNDKAYTFNHGTSPYYVKTRNMLDVVISKSFYSNKAKIKLSISNVLSEPFIIYQDINYNGKLDDPLVIKLGAIADGMRSFDKSGFYKNGTDNISSKINGQRAYSLTFSYTF